MIPDILVSKYLDGDLSIEEDVELRKRLSEDPSAKEAFDAAILIHIAMSCADPFEVPEDARRDTLTAVFARIEASAAPLELPAIKSVSRMGRPLAMALALVLLVSIPIGEPDLLFIDGEKAEVAAVHKSDVLDSRTLVGPRPRAELSLATFNSGSLTSTPQASEIQFVEDLPVATDEAMASVVSVPVATDPVRVEPEWVEEPTKPSLAMVLGTYVGAGIGSSDPSLSNTTIVAQSIGYKVSSNTTVGLEFGSLSYANAVSTTANISNRDPSAVHASRINGEDGHTTKLEPAPPNEYTKQSLSTTQSVTRLWGTAFIQQSLFRTSIGELQAKAGVGVDEVGLTGFGRLTGQVRIQKWLSFSIGAEARSLSSGIQSSGGTINSSSVGFLLSAVAGIQITP
ncbi:MAG: hypothetical protein NTX15_09750 [Candidatus Kapabacteria bacterium]|nr:hypothetical protein [Candidatus Kapabacteria bacterium]